MMMREKDERPKLTALAIQNRSEAKNKSISCTECMKTRHSAENCFEIHGYPEWWGDIPRVDSSQYHANRIYFCKQWNERCKFHTSSWFDHKTLGKTFANAKWNKFRKYEW